jgi:LysR family transcriptional regulator, hydrogen peroxide-inducible genes activator
MKPFDTEKAEHQTLNDGSVVHWNPPPIPMPIGIQFDRHSLLETCRPQRPRAENGWLAGCHTGKRRESPHLSTLIDRRIREAAMEMHQVRYFRAMCEELNFTRAALRCNVSQPSLTRAISNLEKEFGGILFSRERSNTRLTELGRAVKPYLDQVYEQAANALEHARKLESKRGVELRLGLMCTVAPTQFVEFISQMRATHPDVHMEIVDSNAGNLDSRLLMGELEAAVYCRPENTKNERLHYLPLFQEQMMIALSPAHKLAKQKEIRVLDLQGEPYLERINCEFGILGDEVFNRLGVDGKTVYRSDRDDWVLAMAAAGLGYAFMPKHLVVHSGVVAIPLIDPEFWREVSLVTVRGRPHSPAVGALIQTAMKTEWLGNPAQALNSLADVPSVQDHDYRG